MVPGCISTLMTLMSSTVNRRVTILSFSSTVRPSMISSISPNGKRLRNMPLTMSCWLALMEDIRLDEFKDRRHSESFNIRRKLNIWFSLHEKFISNQTYETSMASKLKEYQKFITDLRRRTSGPWASNHCTLCFRRRASHVLYPKEK